MADLCQEGWQVCASKSQVLSRNDGGCDGALGAESTAPAYFFATRQGGNNNDCPAGATVGVNDFYGCGNIGEAIQANWGKPGQTGSNCAPLTMSSGDKCNGLKDFTSNGSLVWSCMPPASDGSSAAGR